MKMKPMVYSGNGISELLYEETVTITDKQLQICVVNIRGSHPCGYIRIPDDVYLAMSSECTKPDAICDCNNWHADVHYGITYAEFGRHVDNDAIREGFWIGWDYAHFNDYTYYIDIDPYPWETTYTTKEIVDEAIKAIPTIRFYPE